MKGFGLIIPDSKKKVTDNLKVEKKIASIFNEAEEDFDEDEKELENLRNSKKEKQNQTVIVSKSISNSNEFIDKIHEEALKEDPNIFDYDSSIDSSKTKRNISTNLENKSEPKYMKNILAKAEERKMEAELIKIRNMKRKSNLSGDVEAEEEIFITSAYRERLKELEEKEMELKARQLGEDDGDVTKRKDMSGFYYNLMKRNVSFGGTAKKSDKLNRSKPLEIDDDIQVVEEEEEVFSFGPKRPPK